ncbi:MAG: CHAT domain-containing protein [Kouleothrix sp.]|nr:CHAT domain-containing protein [Kouleothrix sp.]
MTPRSTARKNVAWLAQLARTIERRRVLCIEFQRLLEALERTGVVVAGEALMLQELERLLVQAGQLLETLGQDQPIADAAGQLRALEGLLTGPTWDLGSQIHDELRARAQSQEDLLRDYRPRVRKWRSNVSALEKETLEAWKVRAPIGDEKNEIRRINDLVSRAERALDDPKQYGLSGLTEPIDYLEQGSGKIQTLIDDIRRSADIARPYARQADLLLLQAPLADGRYQYQVLMRTPSEPGTHGINIQGSSTVVEPDRRLARIIIDEVTEGINQGLVRRFAPQVAAAPLEPPGANGAPAAAVVAAGNGQEQLRRYLPASLFNDTRGPLSLNQRIQDVGDLMYRLFVPDQMQDYLIRTDCSLTITTNDLELPWELMYCPGREPNTGEFLCLSRPVARMPMGHYFPRSEVLPRPGPERRFLLIYSDPLGNLALARKEIETIRAALEAEAKDRVMVETISLQEVSGRKLNEVLRYGAYDVIHYAGHAFYDSKDPDLSGLLLHGEELLFAQKIRRLLKGRPLVFLNACESGRTANEAEPQVVDYQLLKPAEGLASAFIYGGALGCIGSLWPVYDDSAAAFAIEFYRRVLDGDMIGTAMLAARRSIRSNPNFSDQITWAAFVLYGDPTFRIADSID